MEEVAKHFLLLSHGGMVSKHRDLLWTSAANDICPGLHLVLSGMRPGAVGRID